MQVTGGRSVRDTLRRIMMATTASALLLACVAFLAADFIASQKTVEADLTSLADVIGSNSAAALMFGDRESAATVLSALTARPSIVSACLYNERGQMFQGYAPAKSPALYPKVSPPPGRQRKGLRFSVTRPVMFDGKKIGSIWVTSDLRDFLDRMEGYVLLALSILIVSLIVALFLSSALQRIISDPILRLAQVAEQVRRDRNYGIRAGVPTRAPDEITLLFGAFDDMLAETQQRNDELRSQQADLERQVQARTSELQSANAELVVARDVAQRSADSNERLSRHRQTILDATVEGIFGLDERGLATFINTSAAQLLGYSPEELIGRRLHSLIHPEEDLQQQLVDCAICSSSLPSPLRTGSDNAFVHRSGRRIPVDYTTTALHSEGAAGPGVVVTFRDITERRAIDRMKDEFVSTVSHELRTPLTSIRGALGLLSGGLMGAVTPAAQQMLSIAVGNTDRLVRLINDILDLEKMSSGRVELNQTTVAAADLVREAIEVVRVVADRAGVSIHSDDMDGMLRVDRDRIVQTLTNLLGNAVKFSPPGSSVRVAGTGEGEWFRFSVIDRGRGIPDTKLEAIFERFQQVDASDSRDKGGTGLGLAITRSIVATHGGRIWAESRESEGSSFHFTVPLLPAGGPTFALPGEEAGRYAVVTGAANHRDAPPSRDADETLPGGYRPHLLPPSSNEEECVAALVGSVLPPAILIVEDDADLARVMIHALRDAAFEVVWASTAAQAIESLLRRRPALVILDLILPDQGGFGVVEQMRCNESLCTTPVVVYSAIDVGPGDEARLRLGPGEFLTKSRASLNELVKTARKLTGLHRPEMEENSAA